jgi:SET domain-containing protein
MLLLQCRHSSTHFTCFIVGSLSCPATYINTVHKDSLFDTTRTDQITFLSRNVPDYLENPITAVNCEFVEQRSLQFNPKKETFFTFDSFLQWLDNNPVSVYALRDIEENEELFVSYNVSPSIEH